LFIRPARFEGFIMYARRGLSLTEVLIAIFIMAIGMISLLALFPIGMIRMAQAIRTNRVATSAANAQSLLELHAVRDWQSQVGLSQNLTGDWIAQAIRKEAALYDNTGNNLFATSGLHTCPVYVDPLGSALWGHLDTPTPPYNAYTAGDPIGRKQAGSTGPANNIGIPRAYSTYAPAGANRSVLYRWYTLEDEITFGYSGLAVNAPLERERRISWAYLWRRPVWAEEGIVDVSLVLYSGRMIAGLGNSGGTQNVTGIFGQEFQCGGPPAPFADPRDNATDPDRIYNQRIFRKGKRNAALNWGSPAQAQAVQPGYWVLDATMLDNNNTVPGDNQWHLNGFFYQILNVGDIDQNGRQLIELDRPAREDGYMAVIPIGIVDVIEKNDGRRPY
jgi:uncharacterized protein (TIGR02598 family)